LRPNEQNCDCNGVGGGPSQSSAPRARAVRVGWRRLCHCPVRVGSLRAIRRLLPSPSPSQPTSLLLCQLREAIRAYFSVFSSRSHTGLSPLQPPMNRLRSPNGPRGVEQSRRSAASPAAAGPRGPLGSRVSAAPAVSERRPTAAIGPTGLIDQHLAPCSWQPLEQQSSCRGSFSAALQEKFLPAVTPPARAKARPGSSNRTAAATPEQLLLRSNKRLALPSLRDVSSTCRLRTS